MNIEERARLAVARVPSPGVLSTLLGRHVRGSLLAGTGVASTVLYAVAWRLGTGATLALLAAVCALLALLTRQLLSARASARGPALVVAGDLDAASRLYFELLQRAFIMPSFRATYAVSLGSIALMAGHADRAIVLLRAVEASGSLPRGFDATLRSRLALTMLALGRADEARAVLASARALSTEAVREQIGVELLVEALTGTVEAARAVVERFNAIRREGASGPAASAPGAELQRAFGWLVVAFVWDRAARAIPRGAGSDTPADARRAELEGRRAAALHLARNVPAFAYRYLAPTSADFVAFAEANAAP